LGTAGDGGVDKLGHPLFFGDVEEIWRIEEEDEEGEDWSPLMQCIRGGIWWIISVDAVVVKRFFDHRLLTFRETDNWNPILQIGPDWILSESRHELAGLCSTVISAIWGRNPKFLAAGFTDAGKTEDGCFKSTLWSLFHLKLETDLNPKVQLHVVVGCRLS
jgi:hypothetical protein